MGSKEGTLKDTLNGGTFCDRILAGRFRSLKLHILNHVGDQPESQVPRLVLM